MCYGQYVKGTNSYPLVYTKTVRIVGGGEYSWDGKDNRILSTTLSTFDCYLGQTKACTHYLSIGY